MNNQKYIIFEFIHIDGRHMHDVPIVFPSYMTHAEVALGMTGTLKQTVTVAVLIAVVEIDLSVELLKYKQEWKDIPNNVGIDKTCTVTFLLGFANRLQVDSLAIIVKPDLYYISQRMLPENITIEDFVLQK